MNKKVLLSFILGAFVIIGLRFFPLLLGKTIAFGDNFSLMVPGKLYSAEWLRQGELPLWNPYILGGVPWLADVNQSVLYPSTFVFMILRPAIALNVTIFFHLVLTFVGMAVLARQYTKQLHAQMFAAVLWTLSPQIAAVLNNIASLQSLSWMPWVVLAASKVHTTAWWKAAFVGFVFVQFLGGYPQYVLYSIVCGVALQTWQYWQNAMRRDAKVLWQSAAEWLSTWSIAAVTVLLTTAVLWKPFLEVLENSTRAVQSYEQATTGSLQFYELSKILFPYLFEQQQLGMIWGPSWNAQPNVFVYVGWFGLGLSAVWLVTRQKKRQDWFFVSGIVLSVLMAFGKNIPILGALYALPILSSARGASTILCVTALLASLWLSQLYERIVLSPELIRKGIAFFACVGIGSLLAYMIVATQFSILWPQADILLGNRLSNSVFHTLERDQVIVGSFLLYAGCAAALLASHIWAWQKKVRWLVIGILALELSMFTQTHFFFVPNTLYDVPSRNSAASQVLSGIDLMQQRLLPRNYNAPYTDFGAYWDSLIKREPFTDSYVDATELRTMQRAEDMKQGATPNWNAVQGIPAITGYTTLLPTDIATEFADKSARSTQADLGINRLDEVRLDNSSLQRWAVAYYLVDTWFPIEPAHLVDMELIAEHEQLQLYAVPDAVSRFHWKSGEPASVSEIVETANSLSFTVQVPEAFEAAEELVIADRFDENWLVQVDGEQYSLSEIAGQRAILLLPGQHTVHMQYRTQKIQLAVLLSGVGLVLASVWTAFSFIQSRVLYKKN